MLNYGKGPAVGPTGINIKDVVDEINNKTMVFRGLTVPVRIECNPETKQFEIFIETPSTASLLLKEAGVEKGSSNCVETKIGDLTLEQVQNVVEAKREGDFIKITALRDIYLYNNKKIFNISFDKDKWDFSFHRVKTEKELDITPEEDQVNYNLNITLNYKDKS